MPYFFILLLKINLVLILFATAYYLILRRLTFYTINRIFLIFGILFSSIYPSINLTDFFHNQKQINQETVAFVPKLNQQVNELVPTNFLVAHLHDIVVVFYIGLLVMALRLIVQFFSLYRLHQQSVPGVVADYKVRILTESVSPFSFWQTVYINPLLHKEKELQTILSHEQIHVKQWHSLDIILAQLSVVFYWFNPGVWLIKKAIKENLEFLTDQKILNKGIDKKAYQYSLLDVGNLSPAAAIVNNFNLSDLKKRIKMMNVKPSSHLTLSRYLLVTPILLVTTLVFTISKRDIKTHLRPLNQVLIDHHLIEVAAAPKTIHQKQSHISRSKLIASSKKLDTTTKTKMFVRTIYVDTAMVMNASDLPELPIRATLKNADVSEKVGAVKGKLFFYGKDTVKQVGMRETLKSNQSAMKSDSQISDGPYEKVILIKARASKPIDSLVSSSDILLFVNGKKVSAEEFKTINPQEIKNIDIQKRAPLTYIDIKTK
jgi:hypothetical protein